MPRLTDLQVTVDEARDKALHAIAHAEDLPALELLRHEFLGKKSPLRQLMKQLGGMESSERPAAGALINAAQEAVESAFADRLGKLESAALAEKLARERIDVTLPGTPTTHRGTVHPITATLELMISIFASMGFEVADGPEVETEWMNFDALNIVPNHPARDMHDTFYVDLPPDEHQGNRILRTHTSPIQVRWMMETLGRVRSATGDPGAQPPVAIIAPGRVYRVDDIDATHSPVFHQLECLLVDEGVSFAHLKGTLDTFLQAMFGEGLATRLRPSYFPFTEPSAEIDCQCFACRGKDPECRICKGTGWIEVGGAGMVHPVVLESAGYDPTRVSGFAFGMGVERFAMLRHGIPTIRAFYDNDLRFLRQFPALTP
jgi:phenylalanyl-tRNA synthetase alpha chain